ncbi:MAG: accessory gene regulator B family protein [Halanaerobiaceae bacterium]
MYKRIIVYLTGILSQELNLDQFSEDKLRFGIETNISSLITISLTLILALYLHIFIPVTVILLSSSLLKSFSGGPHFGTVWECSFLTAGLVNISGFLISYYYIYIYSSINLVLAISFPVIVISLLFWSPVQSENKPIDIRDKKKYKYISIMEVICVYIFIIVMTYFMPSEKLFLISFSFIMGFILIILTINPFTLKLFFLYSMKKKGG